MVRRIIRAPTEKKFEKHTNYESGKDDADHYTKFMNESASEKIAKLDKVGNVSHSVPRKMQLFQKYAREERKASAASDAKDETELLIMRLEGEYERMQEELLYQELMFQRTKDELEKKQKQIRDVKKPRTEHT